MLRDYKETLFLPQTDFSLQGVKDETKIRARFGDDYARMKESKGPAFVLHDGPPYANGDIHMGHALNKVLKDFVMRSRAMVGDNIRYTPGWDCHGLPIEWQVEKNLRAEGKSKSDFTAPEFRQLCRDYAAGWVDTQREQFKSLGVIGDWDSPYLTMDFKTEAQIVRNLHLLLMSNMLYRGVKPVLWSPVEETALAEAEVEHHDLKVSSVFVRFWIKNDSVPDTSIVIWTTTPWTLPANRAIAFNPSIEYAVYKVVAVNDAAKVRRGDEIVIAKNLAATTMEKLNVVDYLEVSKFDPRSVNCEHPLYDPCGAGGYEFNVPLIEGEHVTDEVGTGFVHIAPEHGPEDYVCWMSANLGDIPTTVLSDGSYASDVPGFAGMKVLEQTPKGNYIFEFTNAAVARALDAQDNLLASEKVTISYPHSWRSHAPLIYRTTPQWFVDLSTTRDLAVKELESVKFFPESGGNRLKASVGSRPDWLISRQRVWGTPLAIFVHKDTGETLLDDSLNRRITGIMDVQGGDAWWALDNKEFFQNLPSIAHLNPDDYVKVMDVLDVWFDSGCSHTFIQYPPQHTFPAFGDVPPKVVADLYVEGSDQARGWFSSSLLVSTMITDQAPFKAVMTHGFVLDKFGKKMSKSAGNVVDPLVEAPKYGTDVLRLWIALGDYTQDTRVGDQILKTTHDMYRRLRNSLRFLVSNLEGFDESEILNYQVSYPLLEQYMMSLLSELETKVLAAYEEYRFNDVCKLLLDFCTNDLSAFYFDIRKDSLYCDRKDSITRRACRATLFYILNSLTHWLSPILPFTMGEVCETMEWVSYSDGRDSPVAVEGEIERWAKVREVLGAVTAALEIERQAKVIGSPLDANVIVELPIDLFEAFLDVPAADVFRTSQATVVLGDVVAVKVLKAEGQKCARSRRITQDVGSDPRYPDLSARDADAVAYWDKTHGIFE